MKVESVLVACPSEVREVKVEAVLVACPSEVTEVEVEALLVVCPSEVTEVTAVELLGGGGSVTTPVGAAVAGAKSSGDRRELEAWVYQPSVRLIRGGGRENSPTAVVRMLSAEASSVSRLLGRYRFFRCWWIRLWAAATSRLGTAVAWIRHSKLQQEQTEALYA